MQATWVEPQRLPPNVRVKRDPEYPYMSLFLYDLDAPFPYDRRSSPYLHLLRVNVACTAAAGAALCVLGQQGGCLLMGYTPPNPPKGIVHCYRLEVTGHVEPVAAGAIEGQERERFPVKDFQERHGMKVLQRRFFMSSGQNKGDGTYPTI